MAENVAEVMAGRASTVFEKLSTNVDLSNVLMGFLGKITLMCHQMSKPIQGVELSSLNESQNEFRFAMSFNDLVISPMGLWQGNTDIISYARSRSAHLAKVLEANRNIGRMFTEIVNMVEKYCERKNIKFSEFKIKKAYIHPQTNVCIIRAGIPDFKDKYRK